MKSIYLFLLLSTLSLLRPAVLLTAQPVGSEQVGIQSPTAASLGTFGDTPVQFYAGQVDVTIPILGITSHDLSTSVSLRYQSGGVQVEEIPGWAGMNWTLQAGGVITRSVRGLPDDRNQYGYLHTRTALEEVWDLVGQYERGAIGGSIFEPDTTLWPQALFEYMEDLRRQEVDPRTGSILFQSRKPQRPVCTVRSIRCAHGP